MCKFSCFLCLLFLSMASLICQLEGAKCPNVLPSLQQLAQVGVCLGDLYAGPTCSLSWAILLGADNCQDYDGINFFRSAHAQTKTLQFFPKFDVLMFIC